MLQCTMCDILCKAVWRSSMAWECDAFCVGGLNGSRSPRFGGVGADASEVFTSVRICALQLWGVALWDAGEGVGIRLNRMERLSPTVWR